MVGRAGKNETGGTNFAKWSDRKSFGASLKEKRNINDKWHCMVAV